MAEREGFEPSERLRAQRFSRPPRSTTPAPLRIDEMSWSQSATVHIEVRRAAQGAACDFPRRFCNARRALHGPGRDQRVRPAREPSRTEAEKRRERRAQALTLPSRSVYSRCFAKGPKVSLPVARGIPPIPATVNSRPDKGARPVSNSAGRRVSRSRDPAGFSKFPLGPFRARKGRHRVRLQAVRTTPVRVVSKTKRRTCETCSQ
jgi:hypothetical protein